MFHFPKYISYVCVCKARNYCTEQKQHRRRRRAGQTTLRVFSHSLWDKVNQDSNIQKLKGKKYVFLLAMQSLLCRACGGWMAEQSVLLGDIINLLRAVHVSALFMSVFMVHLGSNVQSSLGLDQSVSFEELLEAHFCCEDSYYSSKSNSGSSLRV